MSDCSNPGLRAIGTTRTCGNCAHGSRLLVSCWKLDGQGTHHAASEPACARWAEGDAHRDFDELAEATLCLRNLCGQLIDAVGDLAVESDDAKRGSTGLGTVMAAGTVLDFLDERLADLGVGSGA